MILSRNCVPCCYTLQGGCATKDTFARHVCTQCTVQKLVCQHRRRRRRYRPHPPVINKGSWHDYKPRLYYLLFGHAGSCWLEYKYTTDSTVLYSDKPENNVWSHLLCSTRVHWRWFNWTAVVEVNLTRCTINRREKSISFQWPLALSVSSYWSSRSLCPPGLRQW